MRYELISNMTISMGKARSIRSMLIAMQAQDIHSPSGGLGVLLLGIDHDSVLKF